MESVPSKKKYTKDGLKCFLCGRGYRNCSGVKIFKFPRYEKYRKEWLNILGINESQLLTKRAGLCESHFDKKDYGKRLKSFAVPSLNLCSELGNQKTNINQRKQEEVKCITNILERHSSCVEKNYEKTDANTSTKPENVAPVFHSESDFSLTDFINQFEDEEVKIKTEIDDFASRAEFVSTHHRIVPSSERQCDNKTLPESEPVHESVLSNIKIGNEVQVDVSEHINTSKQNSSTFDFAHTPNVEITTHQHFDRFDHITSSWASILRNLSREQLIFAENLMSFVVVKAQQGELSRHSKVVIHSDIEKD